MASDIPADTAPLLRKRVIPEIPLTDETDLVSAIVGGGIVSVVVGWAWYSYEVTNATQVPWVAPAVAIMIALGVKVGAAGNDRDLRAAMSLCFYFITLLAVAYLVERHRYLAVYGSNAVPGSTSVWTGERAMVQNRLTDATTMLSWVIGSLAAIQTSYLLSRRRQKH